MAPASRYSFTLNNYSEDEYLSLRRSLESSCKYAIIGKEVGESGTPHLQGYCIFLTRCVFSSVKDRLNPRVHVEVSRGSPRQNRSYCRKDGDYWEFGEAPAGSAAPSRSGGRPSKDTIALAFQESIARGHDGLNEFADSFPGEYSFSGHVLLRNSLFRRRPVERPTINVQWFHGPPGSGKSRRAHAELPDAYIKDPKTKWWNGYLLEETCIMDDFGHKSIDLNHLLRWFDRYKCTVETKGGMLPLYVTKFIVTSNFVPSDIFKEHVFTNNVSELSDHPQLEALMRRITLVSF